MVGESRSSPLLTGIEVFRTISAIKPSSDLSRQGINMLSSQQTFGVNTLLRTQEISLQM